MFSLLFPLLAFARAGGAGGGHSSGGGSSYSGGGSYGGGGGGGDAGVFELVFFLMRAGPIGWLVLFGIAAVIYYVITHTNADSHEEAVFRPSEQLKAAMGTRFSTAFPQESYPDFQAKVSKAFLAVQQGWSAQTVAPMRRFITDGVYQRFHAQFTMMKLLEQSNPVTQVQVLGTSAAKVGTDGAYDFVDVMIQASANDQFVSRKFPQLNSPGGVETFTEFWTFIRRTDHRPGKDIFHTDSCPQCAAPLTQKLMETARCPYCGVYLNSGEFDWVLAEITQSADYGVPALPSSSAGDPALNVRAMDPAFSAKQLEDKASNAFMEILVGTSLGQPDLVKRFATPEAFAQLQQTWPKGRLAFDRLCTRAVDLLETRLEGTTARAWVAVRYAFHRVDLEHPVAPESDEPLSVLKVVTLTHDFSGGVAKGSVYAGSCPHCGAPQKDSLNPLCDHCGQPLNDQKLDWMIEGVTDAAGYRSATKVSPPTPAP
jgi:Zn-finger nucleic acid-binding protein